jgi:hypothetical protein
VDLARQWARRHRQVVTRRQHVCGALAFVLRRPWLTGVLVAALAHLPGLARPFVRALNAPA